MEKVDLVKKEISNLENGTAVGLLPPANTHAHLTMGEPYDNDGYHKPVEEPECTKTETSDN